MFSDFNIVISFQSGGQDQERRHKKRRGEFYSIQTSLIVAALKKMLPIGLNMCTPGDQELISLSKTRYLLVRPLLCDHALAHTLQYEITSPSESIYPLHLRPYSCYCLIERHR